MQRETEAQLIPVNALSPLLPSGCGAETGDHFVPAVFAPECPVDRRR